MSSSANVCAVIVLDLVIASSRWFEPGYICSPKHFVRFRYWILMNIVRKQEACRATPTPNQLSSMFCLYRKKSFFPRNVPREVMFLPSFTHFARILRILLAPWRVSAKRSSRTKNVSRIQMIVGESVQMESCSYHPQRQSALAR